MTTGLVPNTSKTILKKYGKRFFQKVVLKTIKYDDTDDLINKEYQYQTMFPTCNSSLFYNQANVYGKFYTDSSDQL